MPNRRSPQRKFDVRALRERMGLSQTDLVEKIWGERNRMHQRSVRRWEREGIKPSAMAQSHLDRIVKEFEAQHGKDGRAPARSDTQTGPVRPRTTRIPNEATNTSTNGNGSGDHSRLEPASGHRPAAAPRLAPGILSN